MAQTTTATPQSIAEIEVSTDGTTWQSICGTTASVSFSGGEQMVGEQATQCGDTPVVVASGKVSAITAEFNIVYTETTNEAFDFVQDVWETAGPKQVYVRYSPGGGDSGDVRFFATNAAGSAPVAVPIVSALPPDNDDGGGVLMASFSVIAPWFKRETIA